MGNVRKRGRHWQVRLQVAGERIEKIVPAEMRTEAVRILKQMEAEALRSPLPFSSAWKVKFDELARDLENNYHAKGNRSLETLAARLTNLKRHFTGRLATSITTADAEAYTASRLAEGASPGTVRAELAKLRRMFNLAWQSQKLYHKPYVPLPRESKPRQGFFTAEQCTALLEALPDYLKPVAEFAYRTGWRRSEITSLQWGQVDLQAREIRLSPGTTKNDEGRVLPLEDELWNLVQRQWERRVEGCPWVFHRRAGRVGRFYKAWEKACEKAGCDGKLFHDFRRTVVQNCRRAGIADHLAMRITGHKTTEVFRRYDPVAEPDLRDAVWKLQAASSQSGTEMGQAQVIGTQNRKAADCQLPERSAR